MGEDQESSIKRNTVCYCLAHRTGPIPGSYQWQPTDDWLSLGRYLPGPGRGRGNWRVRDTGGRGRARLCSCNPASPTGPPGFCSPRACAPSSSRPATAFLKRTPRPFSSLWGGPAAGVGLAPGSGRGCPDSPGTHGVKAFPDRERSAGAPRQPKKQTPPTPPLTRRPLPQAILPAPHIRSPDSPPAKVPHAVKNQLQVAVSHGAAAHRAPKPDAPNSPRAGAWGHPAPPSAEVAAVTTRPAPPRPPRPRAGGHPACGVPARPRDRAARGAELSRPVRRLLSPHRPATQPLAGSPGFSPPPGPLPNALWAPSASIPQRPRGRGVATVERGQGGSGGSPPSPRRERRAARVGPEPRIFRMACPYPRLSGLGDWVCGSPGPASPRGEWKARIQI